MKRKKPKLTPCPECGSKTVHPKSCSRRPISVQGNGSLAAILRKMATKLREKAKLLEETAKLVEADQ